MDKAFVFNMALGVYVVSVCILSWIINYYDGKDSVKDRTSKRGDDGGLFSSR